MAASRTGSPDRDYYLQAAARLGHQRACLAIARRLLKRSYHTLRELGDEALQPASALIVRQRPTSTDAPRPAPDRLLLPRPRGLPAKTERPHPLPSAGTTPHNHHVAGP